MFDVFVIDKSESSLGPNKSSILSQNELSANNELRKNSDSSSTVTNFRNPVSNDTIDHLVKSPNHRMRNLESIPTQKLNPFAKPFYPQLSFHENGHSFSK